MVRRRPSSHCLPCGDDDRIMMWEMDVLLGWCKRKIEQLYLTINQIPHMGMRRNHFHFCCAPLGCSGTEKVSAVVWRLLLLRRKVLHRIRTLFRHFFDPITPLQSNSTDCRVTSSKSTQIWSWRGSSYHGRLLSRFLPFITRPGRRVTVELLRDDRLEQMSQRNLEG